MRPSQPVRSTTPVAGNSAAFQPRQPALMVELAVLVEDLLDHYVDPDRGFDCPEECLLLDRAPGLLERARKEGVLP